MYVLAAPLILVSVAFLVITVAQFPRSWATWTLALPGSLLMAGFFIYAVLEAKYGTYFIDASGIAYRSKFMQRYLAHNEVRGFWTNEHYLHIVPVDRKKKAIKISIYTERYAEITDFVIALYPNLADVDPELQDALMSNPALGASEAERAQALKRAKRVAGALNVAGCAAAAWTLFNPDPYDAAVITCSVMVIACLPVLAAFKGVIHVNQEKNSPYPSVFLAILMPALVVMLRALLDFDLLDPASVVPYACMAGALITVACFAITKELSFRRWGSLIAAPVMALAMTGYVYGVFTFANCFYDGSLPAIHTATVEGKHIVRGKHTSYNITLAPWGPRTGSEDVSVPREDYERIDTGDQVDVHLFNGRLGAAWFYVVTGD